MRNTVIDSRRCGISSCNAWLEFTLSRFSLFTFRRMVCYFVIEKVPAPGLVCSCYNSGLCPRTLRNERSDTGQGGVEADLQDPTAMLEDQVHLALFGSSVLWD